MTFVVNPSSVSFTGILADLEAFLDSAPDAVKWHDFFQSTTGTLVKQLIAGLGSFLQYNIVTARRETSIRYAKNRSSVIAAAESDGYSAFRGKNAVLQMTVTPNVTTVWPRWTVLGTVLDQDLILESQTVTTAGVPVTVNVIVGEVFTDQLVAASASPALFRFRQPGFSEDVRVFLNAVEAETSERLLDLVNAKFVIQSNVLGAVDVLYLNLDNFLVQYTTGGVVSVEWIGLNNLAFVLTDVKFLFGALTALQVLSTYKDVETTASIAINGPLFNETQFVVRGRDDYRKIFLLTDTSIISASGQDVSPAVVKLFYVRSDNSLFTAAEKAALVTKLSASRPFGVSPPLISDPTINFLNLAVTAQLQATGNIQADVDDVVQAFANVLEVVLDFTTLENTTDQLAYVKTCRYAYDPSTWLPSHVYKRGEHVVPSAPTLAQSGFVYEALSKLYRSGPAEPAWSASLGAVNMDNVPDTSAGTHASALYGLGGVGPGGEVKFIASNPGLAGNHAALQFDGILTNKQVVDRWNAANPSNAVQMSLRDLNAGAAFVVSPGTAAATASATSAGTTFTAVVPGSAGNSILLSFTGSNTVHDAVLAWNDANPNNQATYSPVANGPNTPVAGSVGLLGGSGSATYVVPGGGTGPNGAASAGLAGGFVVGAEGSGNAAGINGSGSGLVWTTIGLVAGPDEWAPSTTYYAPGQIIDAGGIPKVGSIVVPSAAAVIANPALSNRMFQVSDTINRAGKDLACTTAQVTQGPVTFVAGNGGTAGNSIALVFDGTATVQKQVIDWNLKNPDNKVAFQPALQAAYVPPAGTITCIGGAGGQAGGSYTGVQFFSDTFGTDGNEIGLIFDGTKTVEAVVNDWNTKYQATSGGGVGPHSTDPTNIDQNLATLALYAPFSAASTVLPAGTLTLGGGLSASNKEPVWPANAAAC